MIIAKFILLGLGDIWFSISQLFTTISSVLSVFFMVYFSELFRQRKEKFEDGYDKNQYSSCK